MKKLPEINIDYGSIEEIIYAPIRSQLLLTAINLKVFNYLNRAMSANAIAKALNTHQKNTELFLDGLVACHLLIKINGMYQNTKAAAAFLVDNQPAYLGNWFKLFDQASKKTLDNLTGLIKNGPPAKDMKADMNSEEMCVHYTHAHAATELAGIAKCIAQCVVQLPEFPSFKKMLDLGGGPGLNAAAIIAVHPNMTGVVFDRERVVAIAKKYIQEYANEERISVKAGDYFNDPIGEGYDLILASDTLYYGHQDTEILIHKLFDSLNPSGVLVAVHGVLTHERTKPESLIFGILPEALMGQGELPDSGFLADFMLQAGFKAVQTRELKIPNATMELDIGRKG